jgi:multidrug resistance efflux pump
MQQALSGVRQERASLASQITVLRGEIGIADARLRVATERLRFGSVTSPVAGILADLKINGTGSLISAGSPVATVVPESEPLALMVQVANKDIGLVHPGTGAQIKVDAFPFQQYGTIPAEVVRVLPNVTKDNTFPVRLRLLKSALSNGSSHVNVFPGLNVQADLITSRQRLISLLFASDGTQ